MNQVKKTDETIKILIVEDGEDQAERLRLTLEGRLAQAEIRIQNSFDDALDDLRPIGAYDAVVLDLYLGEPFEEQNRVGQRVWEQIWETRLIPVAIHTGGEFDIIPLLPDDNPFVRCIQKSAGSDDQVAEYLLSVRPHMLALREAEKEFHLAINTVLKETAPSIWKATVNEESSRSTLLLRSARRRLAAMMDSRLLSSGEQMIGWEQYIYPPLEDSLLTGDIIRTIDSAPQDPEAHCLVLTPSCDLQMNSGKCKVVDVLVAKCVPIDRFLTIVMSTGGVKEKDLTEKLPRFLTEPHSGGLIPLPGFVTILPNMAADLRKLELIPVGEIGINSNDPRRYVRIASVDSPFREYISWAYLTVSGRPGVPERDMVKWSKEISEKTGSGTTASNIPTAAAIP